MRFDFLSDTYASGLRHLFGGDQSLSVDDGAPMISVRSASLAPTGSFEFAVHTAVCCPCGSSHDYELYSQKSALAAAGGPVSTASAETGPVFAGDVPGDTSTTATLTVGGSVVDTIEVSGDQDWFQITLVAGQRYQFTLTGTGADPLDDPYLEIMDSSGAQVRFNDDSGGTLNSSLYFTPSTSGTYYVNAHGWADNLGATSTGQYTLTAATAPPIEDRTFDGVANFLTSEYWSPRHWTLSNLTFNVDGLSAGAQLLAIQALEAWSEVTSLSFTQVSTAANITFQNTEDGAFASTTLSGTDGQGFSIITSATINIAADWFGGDLTLDSYTYQTFLHEIGHAIGLGHAGPYNSSATYGQDNVYNNDNWSYTVMSYFDQAEAGFGSYRFVLGPQIADILAVQYLYGADPAGARTGNTTYGFNSTESDVNDWSQFVVVETEGTYLRPPSMAIYDTGGIDTIDLSGFSRDQNLSLVQETFSSLGDRPINNAPTYVNNISIARGTVIENAIGGSGNDTITGNSVANVLQGRGGNDNLFGGGGNDTLRGGTGADVLDGGSGIDTADYTDATGAVNVQLWLGTGAGDVAAGDSLVSIENITGGTFGDTLTGNSANNTLLGNGGNDSLNGGKGDDILRGGTGADVLIGGVGFDTADYSDATGAVSVGLWNNSASGNVAAGDTFSGIEALSGGAYNDSLSGDSGNNTLIGNGGNDSLNGGKGDDILRGGTGADALIGGDGFDLADYSDATGAVSIGLWNASASGNIAAGDTIYSIEGIIGGAYNDALSGDSFNNTLIGNGGNDSLNAGAGDDILRGGAGFDALIGGDGFDTADYSDATGAVTVSLWNGYTSGNIAGGDTLYSIEAVTGGDYNDTLSGDSGNNTLIGNGGNDFLNGGKGADILRGGDGSDIFLFQSGADVIEDFGTTTGDRVDIRSFTSITNLSQLQAFHTQVGADSVFNFGSGNILTMQNVTWAQFSSNDFIFFGAYGEPAGDGPSAELLSTTKVPVAEGTDWVSEMQSFDFSSLQMSVSSSTEFVPFESLDASGTGAGTLVEWHDVALDLSWIMHGEGAFDLHHSDFDWA